jgi:acetolactate synthase-1/2/3 large subunit
MPFVHVHPGPEEIGQVYAPDLGIPCDSGAFWAAAGALKPTAGGRAPGWRAGLAAAAADWRRPTEVPGRLNLGQVVAHMDAVLPDDAILTNGAGNYAIWLHRFFRYRHWSGQVAPTSGSMGYGVPAAVAARLAHPGREVVCVAGDGCFLMHAQELATAVQHGAAPIVVVVNNGMYGTIRMHQERTHPGRVIGTRLVNPDFAAYAAAFGIPGERIETTEEFPAAFARARDSRPGYLIELVVDPEALTPSQSLSAARAQGEREQAR